LFGFDRHSTGFLLPPEFYIFGMSGDKLEPFTAADVLAQGRLISFHLSWNWNQDLAREALRESHPDIADLVEELIPFTTEFLSALVTVVDDEDLKKWNQYSDKTLQERYSAARDVVTKASAPLHPEIVQWQDSIRQKANVRMDDANIERVVARTKLTTKEMEA
jgi:hypothetical protein